MWKILQDRKPVRLLDGPRLQRTMQEHAPIAFYRLLKELFGEETPEIAKLQERLKSESEIMLFAMYGYELVATARACQGTESGVIEIRDVVVAESHQATNLVLLLIIELENLVAKKWGCGTDLTLRLVGCSSSRSQNSCTDLGYQATREYYKSELVREKIIRGLLG